MGKSSAKRYWSAAETGQGFALALCGEHLVGFRRMKESGGKAESFIYFTGTRDEARALAEDFCRGKELSTMFGPTTVAWKDEWLEKRPSRKVIAKLHGGSPQADDQDEDRSEPEQLAADDRVTVIDHPDRPECWCLSHPAVGVLANSLFRKANKCALEDINQLADGMNALLARVRRVTPRVEERLSGTASDRYLLTWLKAIRPTQKPKTTTAKAEQKR